MQTFSPTQIQRLLSGLDYPASRTEIIDYLQDAGADEDILYTLDQLPDRVYRSPIEVSDAISDFE